MGEEPTAFLRSLHEPYLLVYSCYLCLACLEIAAILQVVEYGGHEAIPVAPASYLSGVGCKVAGVAVGCLYYEYSEHLA